MSNDSSSTGAEAGKLPNNLVRQLKARAQQLEPVIKVGHAGLTPELIKGLDEALFLHELVKVKFTGLKDQKKELSPKLAEATRSHLVWRIGNCAVLFRRRPTDGTTA
jgi:RNA-binding protein